MADFENPSFETADSDGYPGIAASWEWVSASYAGEWADFNSTAASIAPWMRCIEQFSAAFAVAWSWVYADVTDRIAAGPFAAEDLGRAALQLDDGSLWVLVSHSPIGWQPLPLAVQDWFASIDDAVLVATLFNGATVRYATRLEMFELWVGLNWLDAPNFTRQDDATFQAMGDSFCGWKGWFDAPQGTAQYPMPVETFSEAWANDPWSTTLGTMWQPDTAPSGTLQGRAITFPLVVPPNQARLDVWQEIADGFFRVDVAPGTYASATDLAVALQAAWSGTVAATFLIWTAWADSSGNTGVQLGWNGASGIDTICFGVLSSERDADLRPLIGMVGFAPDASTGQVRYPVALLTVPPAGAIAGDYYEMDPWSLLVLRTEYDLLSGIFQIPYNWEFATWNETTHLLSRVQEMMDLEPWSGAGAVWETGWPGTSTSATFLGGVASGIVESFENAATYWPDNLWV